MASMTKAGGRAAGLAAYDAWAQDMLRDEDFAGVNLGVLQDNCMGIGDNGIILLCARKVAADYLDMMQNEVGSQARGHLLAAAELHRKESETMGAAHDVMPWGSIHGEELLKRVERTNREQLAQVIVRCKGYFTQAIDEIEKALEAEGA